MKELNRGFLDPLITFPVEPRRSIVRFDCVSRWARINMIGVPSRYQAGGEPIDLRLLNGPAAAPPGVPVQQQSIPAPTAPAEVCVTPTEQTEEPKARRRRAKSSGASEYMREFELLEALPFSRATLWPRVKDDEFPAPFKFGGNLNAWKRADVTDGAAIVRYWAARYAYFREEGPVDFIEKSDQGFFKRKPAAPEDLARAHAARNDPAELVRLSVDRLGILGGDELTSMPQQQRLIAIRNQAHPSFSSFIDWLCKAVEEQIPDDDLATCSAEFFAHPEIVEQLKEDDFADGMTAHLEGKAVTNGWALLKGKAGPRLTAQLVWILPVKRGPGSVKADELASMPERVLSALLHRRGDDATFLELAELIRKQPERFPPDVVKSLQRDDEDYFTMPDAEARAEYRLTNAVDRQAATVEAVIGIRREIVRLRERVDEVYEAATRKRGFFS